jgi:acid phosphatase type 7
MSLKRYQRAAATAGIAALIAVGCTTQSKTGSTTIVAVGDIACSPGDSDFHDGAGTDSACRHRATSDLAVSLRPRAVLALGDTQYDRAELASYEQSYEPTWGRLKDITYPVPGNHEYKTPGAEGYFGYFGDRAGDPDKGYYSFDLGAWHLVALNSECEEVGGCDRGSPQERWLRNDLAGHRDRCVLAYLHAPRFSSGGEHGSDDAYEDFWQALYDAGAEVVLGGHDHHYERFAPLDPDANLDEQRGVRQFVVGTGGAERHGLDDDREHGSEVANDTTYGVLELTLSPDEYRWRFVPVRGDPGFSDSGSAPCH